MNDERAPSAVASNLQQGLSLAGWDVHELWFAAFAIGGNFTTEDIDRIITGGQRASAVEYNVLAATLNEYFSEIGLNHPLPYWADLPRA